MEVRKRITGKLQAENRKRKHKEKENEILF